MTRRERLERKLEKRIEWAEARKSAAAMEFSRADLSEEKSGIPFGQPILVGHHSERRHRRAIERADNAMRRSVENADMAQHHAGAAAGLRSQLNRSIFSDDPNAVEALEAKIAKMEAERELNNKINAIVRQKPRAVATPEKIRSLVALGMSEPTANKLFENQYGLGVGIPSYVNTNLGGRITEARKRVENIKERKQRQQAADNAAGGVLITGAGDYVSITFAEKPEREILDDLKSAGFFWGNGSWGGKRADIPACVMEMTVEPEAVEG